jgi:hypothetical protein
MAAGWVSASSENTAIEEAQIPASEGVLMCLFQWDFMLYSFEARKQGVDREKFESHLLEEYSQKSSPKDRGIIEAAIKDGVSAIYTAETLESNFYRGFSGSIYEGFKSCLASQGVASFESQLQSDIWLAELVTVIAAAKNRGITKAHMLEQYGTSARRERAIQHVYDTPNFNAGSFRLSLWGEAVKGIK